MTENQSVVSTATAVEQNEMPAPIQLLNFMSGHILAKCLNVAAELGVADLLKDGPKSIDYLAERTGSNSQALLRIIRTLASQGVFRELKDKVIDQTQVSFFLQDGVEGSQRNFIRMFSGEWHWKVINNLQNAVKKGNQVLTDTLGAASLWEYFAQQDPDAGEIFSLSMTSLSSSFNEPLATSYDFSEFSSINDIGGSQGSFVRTILNYNNHLKGYVLDLPEVVEVAKEYQEDDLINYIPGSFFEPIPQTTDCQLLRFIIHDWSDEDCLKILKNCRAAISPNGKLLIAEHVIQADNSPGFEKALDIAMLINFGTARERTEEEFRSLLEASGFKLNKIIPTSCPLSIIEAVPV